MESWILGIAIFFIILFPWHVAGICLVLGIVWYLHNQQEKEKYRKQAEEARAKQEAYEQDLINRFGKATADRLIMGEIWTGMTQEMLIESKGLPGYVQQQQLKTKYKEIWSYDRIGKGKYSTSVTLENNIVTAWRN